MYGCWLAPSVCLLFCPVGLLALLCLFVCCLVAWSVVWSLLFAAGVVSWSLGGRFFPGWLCCLLFCGPWLLLAVASVVFVSSFRSCCSCCCALCLCAVVVCCFCLVLGASQLDEVPRMTLVLYYPRVREFMAPGLLPELCICEGCAPFFMVDRSMSRCRESKNG